MPEFNIIKELYKNNRYCDGIEKRSIDIEKLVNEKIKISIIIVEKML